MTKELEFALPLLHDILIPITRTKKLVFALLACYAAFTECFTLEDRTYRLLRNVGTYQSTLRDTLIEPTPHLHRDGSLNARAIERTTSSRMLQF